MGRGNVDWAGLDCSLQGEGCQERLGRSLRLKRIDPVTGFVDELKRIPLSDISASPNEPWHEHPPLQPRHFKTVDREPIAVFGKRFRGDTYQIINGHRRTLAAMQLGKRDILAWVTKVDRAGSPIRAKTVGVLD